MQLVKHGFFQTLIWFFTLILLFWIREFFLGYSHVHGEDFLGMMPLADSIDSYVSRVGKLDMILTLLLVFVNSFFITRIVIRHVIFISRSYSMALIYLALCSLLPSSSVRYLSYLSVFFLLFSLDCLMTIFRRKRVAYRLFLSGALLSFASLIYAPMVVLFPVAIMGVILYEHSNFRELLSYTIGFLSSIFGYSYIHWLMGGDFLYLYRHYISTFSDIIYAQPPTFASVTLVDIVYGAALFIVVLYSIIFYLGRLNQERTKPLRTYSLFLLMLFLLLVVTVLYPIIFQSMMPLLSIPISVIVVTMLTKNSLSPVVNLAYIFLILGALVVNLKGFFVG